MFLSRCIKMLVACLAVLNLYSADYIVLRGDSVRNSHCRITLA
jgi:hypothetical protein